MSSPRFNHPTTSSSSTTSYHHTRSYLDSILTVRSFPIAASTNQSPTNPISNPTSTSASASAATSNPPTLTRSPSFLSATGSVSAYRPQKPSTLSSTEHLADDDDDEEEEEEEEEEDVEGDESSSSGQDERRALGSLVSKLDQDDSDPDDYNHLDSSSSSNHAFATSNFNSHHHHKDLNLEPSLMTRVGSSTSNKDKSFGSSLKDVQNEIISALDRDEDDEERIEIVREKLNRALIEVEGFEVPSSRLDNVVLDLLHRHREDRNPTGATFPFPASPIRRPSSVRSFTGTPGGANQTSRPWTPSNGGGILEKPGTPNQSLAEPSSIGLGGLPLTPGGSIATSNSPWNTFGFGTSTPSGSSGFQLQAPVSPSPQNSQPHPGVIGSGSPRASPRLWNRSIASLAGGSAKDLFASASGVAPSSLGSAGVASASSPSSSHSSAIPTSPISSVPPGLAAPASRPASPSPLGSPRLNVSAAAFKPRTGSASSSSTASGLLGHQLSSANSSAFIPRGGNSTRRGSAASTSSGTALANKSHAGAGEDDDDEFSPFGSKPTPSFGRPTSGSTIATSSRGHAVGGAESDFGWYSGSASGTSATSSSGGYEPSPLSMAAQASGEVGGDDEYQQQQMISGTMSPFDVLYSILAGVAAQQASNLTSRESENSNNNPTPSWSPEQVEEALSRNGWDVEATLSAIIENGGQPYTYNPPPARPKSPPSAPKGAIGISSPRGSTDGTSSSQFPPLHPISHPVQNPVYRQHHHTLQNEIQQSHRVGNSGVALLSREAFASHRAATGGPSNPSSPSHRYASVAGTAASPGKAGSHPSVSGVGRTPSSPARNQFLPPGSGPGGAAPGMPSPYSLAAAQSSQSSIDRRVCRYFLAGECRRADCRFSHNLEKALCRFWLRGQCLNDPCNFVHDNDLTSIASLTNGMHSSSISDQVEPETPPVDEFPELGMSIPKGPKAQTSKMAASKGTSDPSAPSGTSHSSASSSTNDQQNSQSPQAPEASKRWANAVQRKPAPTPLSLVQEGEAGYTSLHSRGAPIAPRNAPPPSGPRSSGLPPSGKVSRLALRAPTLLPTLQTGKSASIAYSNYRSALLALSEQRNQCLAKASQAYRSGNGAQARKWSAEGQSLNSKIVGESKIAALNLLKDRHSELRERLFDGDGLPGWGDEPGARSYKGKLIADGIGICLGVAQPTNISQSKAPSSLEERTECFIDLHGLHAEEAVEFAEEFLLTLERESMKGLAFLGVGLGRHTATSTDRRRVPLATALRNFLSSWGYPYGEQEGILVVDPLTHH